MQDLIAHQPGLHHISMNLMFQTLPSQWVHIDRRSYTEPAEPSVEPEYESAEEAWSRIKEKKALGGIIDKRDVKLKQKPRARSSDDRARSSDDKTSSSDARLRDTLAKSDDRVKGKEP